MKKNWKVIVGLVLVLIIIIFAMLNMEKATINFGFVQVNQPLIILIVASTLIGALIVALFSSASIFSKNREIKNLQKEITHLNKEMQHKIDVAVQKEKEAMVHNDTAETQDNEVNATHS